MAGATVVQHAHVGTKPNPETAPAPSAESEQSKTMQAITITRTGQPPLRFVGEEISQGDTKTADSNRWTVVTLYRTKGGKYVSVVKRITQWQGEHNTTEATVYPDAQSLIEGLRNEGGTLGPASQEALDRATGRYGSAVADDGIAAAYVETVD